jgi:hypothetical protein
MCPKSRDCWVGSVHFELELLVVKQLQLKEQDQTEWFIALTNVNEKSL